jgi:hypothetical protein
MDDSSFRRGWIGIEDLDLDCSLIIPIFVDGVHLLTREAMDLYLQRIRGTKSVHAFHVSNSSLDLRPVLSSLARTYQLATLEVNTPVEVHPTWILLSRDPAALRAPNLVAEGKELKTSLKIVTWTDNHISFTNCSMSENGPRMVRCF